MPKNMTMPDDVKRICIMLVRGYERRVREYHARRQEIIEGSPSRYEVIPDPTDPQNWKKSSYFYPPSSHTASRTGEDKAMQLLGLEELQETRRMRAVEQAISHIGLDLPEDLRRKLVRAILLNCQGGRIYPFEVLDVEGVGRSGFYARRLDFLMDIAIFLDLVKIADCATL